MSYEESVRAILQCCFSQSKDELIESAVKAIVALKQEPIVVNPITTPTYPIMPYYTTPDITPNVTPHITCTGVTEDLKNSSKSGIIV
jgi:hypothetical protein